MPARLILYRDNQKLGMDLKDGVYRLGRDKPADVIIPDPTVSANHAELQVSGTKVMIRDLGSTNGTFIDNVPVRQATEIKPSDDLRLGSVRIAIEMVEAPKPAAPVQQKPVQGPTVRIAEAKRAAGGLSWSARFFLAGAAAIVLLLVLVFFVSIYNEKAAADVRLSSRFKTFASQYMHVLNNPELKEVPAPSLESSLQEPIMVADRNGKIVYPAPEPGSKQPSPLVNPETNMVWDVVKEGRVPLPNLVREGETVPYSYPVRIGGDLLGFVIAKPAGDPESKLNFVLLMLTFCGGIALLALFLLLRPINRTVRAEIENVRLKLSPLANGFVEELPRSRAVPELNSLAEEIEKELNKIKEAASGAAAAGAGASGGADYLPMVLPLLESASVAWCFVDGDFRILSLNPEINRIDELAGATKGVSIFDTGLNSLQSKQLVSALAEARSHGRSQVTFGLSQNGDEYSHLICIRTFTDPATRGQMFGLVLNRAA